jgi:hypothetical protein
VFLKSVVPEETCDEILADLEYSQCDFSSKISFFFLNLSSGRVGGVLVSSSVCLPTCR